MGGGGGGNIWHASTSHNACGFLYLRQTCICTGKHGYRMEQEGATSLLREQFSVTVASMETQLLARQHELTQTRFACA